MVEININQDFLFFQSEFKHSLSYFSNQEPENKSCAIIKKIYILRDREVV
jgi:hypothetical protein